jgi:hypothetical protein
MHRTLHTKRDGHCQQHPADGIPVLHLHAAAARASLQQQMRTELEGLAAAVAATPPDPTTQPGDGIGIYSPGFKRLGQIEQLVRGGGQAAA